MSIARAAAIVSGLPLNVPTCSYDPSTTISITSAVPPIAPHGMPPPSALARHTMSGCTPNIAVTPPGPIVSPVFTSSNVSSTPWSRVSRRTPSR